MKFYPGKIFQECFTRNPIYYFSINSREPKFPQALEEISFSLSTR